MLVWINYRIFPTMSPKEKAEDLLSKFWSIEVSYKISPKAADLVAYEHSLCAAEEFILYAKEVGLSADYWQQVVKELRTMSTSNND